MQLSVVSGLCLIRGSFTRLLGGCCFGVVFCLVFFSWVFISFSFFHILVQKINKNTAYEKEMRTFKSLNSQVNLPLLHSVSSSNC